MRIALPLLALALALPGGAAAAAPQRGYELYAENCSRCHGTLGVGIADQGPPLRDVGALAADFYLRTGYMPLAHPGEQPTRSDVGFSPRELDDLVAYVASLGTGPPVPRPHPERGSLARGLTAFTRNCAGCHQVAARGGYLTGAVAPPLDSATPTQIAEAVRLGPFLMPRFSTRAISSAELDSIIAYVEYAKRPPDPGGWSIGRLGPVPEGLIAWLLAGTAVLAFCLAIGRRAHR
jgi:ubiquinol-cytochrome c reductase cytochrome c subunit